MTQLGAPVAPTDDLDSIPNIHMAAKTHRQAKNTQTKKIHHSHLSRGAHQSKPGHILLITEPLAKAVNHKLKLLRNHVPKKRLTVVSLTVQGLAFYTRQLFLCSNIV